MEKADILHKTKFPDFLLNNVNRSNVDNSELCLLEQAARGERDARRELFELHREAAYRVALRVTGRYEDALDVVQDGFIRAFERLGEFQQTAGFRTWLLRIVTNRALDLLRARKVRLAVSLDGGDDESRAAPAISGAEQRPDAAMQQRELGQRLRQAVEALPLEQRAGVRFVY